MSMMFVISSILNMYILRTGCSLFDYAEPKDVLFHPSKAYMKSASLPFGLRAPMPAVSTSGGATPMPDETFSLTPAWNPLSRTPRYS
jgi:hypothetical protein